MDSFAAWMRRIALELRIIEMATLVVESYCKVRTESRRVTTRLKG